MDVKNEEKEISLVEKEKLLLEIQKHILDIRKHNIEVENKDLEQSLSILKHLEVQCHSFEVNVEETENISSRELKQKYNTRELSSLEEGLKELCLRHLKEIIQKRLKCLIPSLVVKEKDMTTGQKDTVTTQCATVQQNTNAQNLSQKEPKEELVNKFYNKN